MGGMERGSIEMEDVGRGMKGRGREGSVAHLNAAHWLVLSGKHILNFNCLRSGKHLSNT